MKLVQINVVVNSGSTGRIVEEIGVIAQSHGIESYIAHGRGEQYSASTKMRIGNKLDFYSHCLLARIFDKQGLGSVRATNELVKWIKQIKPDIIHLHNIHGYYLNFPILFRCLHELNIPIVWTLHDCWPFTGHCAYFTFVKCTKWKVKCLKCPNKKSYPSSLLFDNSANNFSLKKSIFTQCKRIHFVPVSSWLSDLLASSFFCSYPKTIINNGIDLSIFKPNYNVDGEVSHNFMILGVANVWDHRKGLQDFIELRAMLDNSFTIMVIGVSKKQKKMLPDGIIGLEHTESVQELSLLYSRADVFFNPTYEDNFPTTNLEALACGTPVITYNTGGSPESITVDTGFIVEQHDLDDVVRCIKAIKQKRKASYINICRSHAERFYSADKKYLEYLELYKKLLFKY